MTDDIPPLTQDAYDRVLDGVLRSSRRRRRRRDFLVGGLAGAVLAVVLGGAAWVVLAPQQVRERNVSCYPQADLSSTPAEGQRALTDKVTDAADYAVDFCAALWKAGVVDPGKAAPQLSPPLELCTRLDGTYLVFPRPVNYAEKNAQFCDDLGLVPDPRS